ncbi:hypothetical protein ERN12_14000 [Rhodobacteraceae bacterium]|nr:hypothetical protein ERN12_14000 [Paracoccaceae bacterium]
MADHNPPPRRDGGMYFILGAIVVALGVLLWFVMGDPATTTADRSDGVSITNQVENPQTDAPVADDAPAQDPAAEVDVAPSADGDGNQ